MSHIRAKLIAVLFFLTYPTELTELHHPNRCKQEGIQYSNEHRQPGLQKGT